MVTNPWGLFEALAGFLEADCCCAGYVQRPIGIQAVETAVSYGMYGGNCG